MTLYKYLIRFNVQSTGIFKQAMGINTKKNRETCRNILCVATFRHRTFLLLVNSGRYLFPYIKWKMFSYHHRFNETQWSGECVVLYLENCIAVTGDIEFQPVVHRLIEICQICKKYCNTCPRKYYSFPH